MKKITQYIWFRAVAVCLVASFFALDIAWAYPNEKAYSAAESNLSTQSIFPAENMQGRNVTSDGSVFSSPNSLAVVSLVADHIYTEHASGRIPEEKSFVAIVIPGLFKNNEALKGFDLGGIKFKDGVIYIPYSKGGKKYAVLIAKNDTAAAKDLPGSEKIVLGKYVFIILPEDFTPAKPASSAAASIAKRSVAIGSVLTGPDQIENLNNILSKDIADHPYWSAAIGAALLVAVIVFIWYVTKYYERSAMRENVDDNSLDGYVAMLNSADNKISEAAIENILRFGDREKAMNALRKFILEYGFNKEPKADVRRFWLALNGLRRMKDPSLYAILITHLGNNNEQIRQASISFIGELIKARELDEATITMVIQHLRLRFIADGSVAVRASARQLLERIGKLTPKTWLEIRGALNTSRTNRVFKARPFSLTSTILGVSAAGAALAAAIPLVRSEDFTQSPIASAISLFAITGLAIISAVAYRTRFDRYAAMLNSPNDKVVEAGLKGIVRSKEHGRATGLLLGLVNSSNKNPHPFSTGIKGLSQIRYPGLPAILIANLGNENEEIKLTVISYIKGLVKSGEVKDALKVTMFQSLVIKLKSDRSNAVRDAARDVLEAAGKLTPSLESYANTRSVGGENDIGEIDAMTEPFSAIIDYHRGEVAVLNGGRSSVFPDLLAKLSSPDDNTRNAAVKALEKLGVLELPLLIEKLKMDLRSDNPQVRIEGAASLSEERFHKPDLIGDVFLAMLGSGDMRVVRIAIRILGDFLKEEIPSDVKDRAIAAIVGIMTGNNVNDIDTRMAALRATQDQWDNDNVFNAVAGLASDINTPSVIKKQAALICKNMSAIRVCSDAQTVERFSIKERFSFVELISFISLGGILVCLVLANMEFYTAIKIFGTVLVAAGGVSGYLLAKWILVKIYEKKLDRTNNRQVADAIIKSDGLDIMPEIIWILEKSRSDRARAGAIYIMGSLRSRSAVPALAKALASDPNAAIRRKSAEALGVIGSDTAVYALMKAFSDDDMAVRSTAIEASGRLQYGIPSGIGAILGNQNTLESDAVTKALTVALSWKDAKIGRSMKERENAAYALGAIGNNNAGPVLIDTFSGANDKNMRLAAIVAAGKMKYASAADFLVKLIVKGADDDINFAAHCALINIGSSSIPYLIKAYRENTGAVKDRIFSTIVAIRDEAAAPILMEALDEPGPNRVTAAEALGELKYKGAGGMLVQCMRDKAMRVIAARALINIDDPSTIEPLSIACEDADPNFSVDASLVLQNILHTNEQIILSIETSLKIKKDITRDELYYFIIGRVPVNEHTRALRDAIVQFYGLTAKETDRAALARKADEAASHYGLTEAEKAILNLSVFGSGYGSAQRNAADEIFDMLKEDNGGKHATQDEIEAHQAVGHIMILARQAQEKRQKLIIGLETDWVPGISEKGSFQRQAMTEIMKEMYSIGEKLRFLGLDNVEIVRGSGDRLAAGLMKAAGDTRQDKYDRTDMRNIVVIASKDTIEKSDGFKDFREAGAGNRPFLSAIDPTELQKQFEETGFGKESEKQLYIELEKIIYATIEIAAGKAPPQIPWMQYDGNMRKLISVPRAEVIDYEKIRGLHDSKAAALRSA